MPDLTLFPEEALAEEPSPARPVRLVSTGLADTAEVPTRISGCPFSFER